MWTFESKREDVRSMGTCLKKVTVEKIEQWESDSQAAPGTEGFFGNATVN